MSLVLINVVEAAAVVDALQRKPEEYKTQSFFGELDLWKYIPVYDEKLCDKCAEYAATQYFWGPELRKNFKYLEIVDENTIDANVHINCRCFLARVIAPREYLKLIKELT